MARKKGSPKTGGRQKGVTNKVTSDLKDMILGALAAAGGQDYLRRQAVSNPGPFMTLVGKVLPRDINAKVEGNVSVTVIEEFDAKS